MPPPEIDEKIRLDYFDKGTQKIVFHDCNRDAGYYTVDFNTDKYLEHNNEKVYEEIKNIKKKLKN